MILKQKIPVEKCVYAVPVESRPDQKNLIMWVRLQDLPIDLKLDPNARRADVRSKIARQIIETLRESPENFWKLNSGIQMTARDVDIKDGRHVTLAMFDAEDEDDAAVSDGVINGGHTYECIKLVLANLYDERENASSPDERRDAANRLAAVRSAVVRVEVLTGIERSELAEISRARNTGESVQKFSLQNLKGLYEPIRQVLGPEASERIGFSENDVDLVPGTVYPVTELIRLMCLFNNQLYDFTRDRHPVVCYSSAGRIVEKWESEAESFRPLVEKLPDLMRLHDQVYLAICAWHSGRKGPKRNGIESKDWVLPFTGRPADHKISSAFVYPILASLRILLNSNVQWRAEPFEFLKSSETTLIDLLMVHYDRECKSKPHELGRTAGGWRALAAETRARFAEHMLAQLQLK